MAVRLEGYFQRRPDLGRFVTKQLHQAERGDRWATAFSGSDDADKPAATITIQRDGRYEVMRAGGGGFTLRRIGSIESGPDNEIHHLRSGYSGSNSLASTTLKQYEERIDRRNEIIARGQREDSDRQDIDVGFTRSLARMEQKAADEAASRLKGRRQTIDLAFLDERGKRIPKETTATVFGPLAIHKEDHATVRTGDGRSRFKQGYNITHVASGMSLTGGRGALPDQASARRVVARIIASGADLSATDPKSIPKGSIGLARDALKAEQGDLPAAARKRLSVPAVRDMLREHKLATGRDLTTLQRERVGAIVKRETGHSLKRPKRSSGTRPVPVPVGAATRSAHALAMDRSLQAATVIDPTDKSPEAVRARARWKRHPGRLDIAGVDDAPGKRVRRRPAGRLVR